MFIFRCLWQVRNFRKKDILSILTKKLTVDNKKRQVSYLIKSPETVPVGLKLPRTGDFSTERHMFEVVLPALEELYQNSDRIVHFGPPVIQAKLKSNHIYCDYILNKGYSVANGLKGLSVTAMEGVLSKLAAYHAGTAAYIAKTPGKIRELPKLRENSKSDEETAELKSLYQLRFHESLRSNDARQYEDKVVGILHSLL